MRGDVPPSQAGTLPCWWVPVSARHLDEVSSDIPGSHDYVPYEPLICSGLVPLILGKCLWRALRMAGVTLEFLRLRDNKNSMD